MFSHFSDWKEKILKNVVDLVTNCVLQDSACKVHKELVVKRPRDVLNQIEVVSVPSRKVDVKAQRQRAQHENFVLVQLGHGNNQRLVAASVQSKVMRMTALFMARIVFSLCVERKFSGIHF